MPQKAFGDKSTLVQIMVGARRQQAIIWANVDPDLCPYMTSLGYNELSNVEISPTVFPMQTCASVGIVYIWYDLAS